MAKAKFDSAKMQQALGAHVEKIGFGAALVFMALLLYFGLQVEPYKAQGSLSDKPTEPAELQKLVTMVRNRVTNKDTNPLDLVKDGISLPEKGQEPKTVIDKLLVADVSPALFAGIEWNKPLFDQKQRRREPEFLALRDLRASYYHSAVDMALRGTPGADGQRAVPLGREWITVTGVVPLSDQTTEFAKAFQNALDTTTNALPEYGIYQLQRAVISADDVEKPIEWEKVEPVDLNLFVTEEIGKWAGTSSKDYIDAKFARAPLTQPLPILANNDYGDWAAHAPEIPGAGAPAAAPATAAGAGQAGAPAAAPATAQNNLFGQQNAAPASAPVVAGQPIVGQVPKPAADAEPVAGPQYLPRRLLH